MYKKIIIAIILMGLVIVGYGKTYNKVSKNNKIEIDKKVTDNNSNIKITVIIDNKKYEATLENNETSKQFINLLPLEIIMNELNGNEKYHYLDHSLPTKSYTPDKITKGDLMLYGDNCIVLFYKTFNTTYSYTKIGHINNLPNLSDHNIKVTFLK